MKTKVYANIIYFSIFTLFTMLTNVCFAETREDLKKRNKELEAENKRLVPKTMFSEVLIPRGTDSNRSNKTIIIFIPEDASNIKIEAFMKNEPWGGYQNPPKPNTDDLGSSHYMECPLGTGECAISWSKVSAPTTTSLENGRTKISATFTNWAHRNDRTGKLLVTYQID